VALVSYPETLHYGYPENVSLFCPELPGTFGSQDHIYAKTPQLIPVHLAKLKISPKMLNKKIPTTKYKLVCVLFWTQYSK
jgi:hypothetical protein